MTEYIKLPSLSGLGKPTSPILPVPAIAALQSSPTNTIYLPVGTILKGTVIERDQRNNLLVATNQGKLVVNSSFPIEIGNEIGFRIIKNGRFFQAELLSLDGENIEEITTGERYLKQNGSILLSQYYGKAPEDESFALDDTIDLKTIKTDFEAIFTPSSATSLKDFLIDFKSTNLQAPFLKLMLNLVNIKLPDQPVSDDIGPTQLNTELIDTNANEAILKSKYGLLRIELEENLPLGTILTFEISDIYLPKDPLYEGTKLYSFAFFDGGFERNLPITIENEKVEKAGEIVKNFTIEFETQIFGKIELLGQLYGFDKNNKNLHFMLKTEQDFPSTMKKELVQIINNLMSESKISSSIKFLLHDIGYQATWPNRGIIA